MWEGCQERKGSCNQITCNTLLHGEHLFISQASISGLPNTGGLPAPGHKPKIDTRDTFCARLIMDRAERFLEITSTSSKVLHPYHRPASVTLNRESIRGLSLPTEEFTPTPFLMVPVERLGESLYHSLQFDQRRCILSTRIHFP